MRYPACFNLKSLQVYKHLWKKNKTESTKKKVNLKFSHLEQELNLDLPHDSQWSNPTMN